MSPRSMECTLLGIATTAISHLVPTHDAEEENKTGRNSLISTQTASIKIKKQQASESCEIVDADCRGVGVASTASDSSSSVHSSTAPAKFRNNQHDSVKQKLTNQAPLSTATHSLWIDEPRTNEQTNE